ncbi:MAG TPA: phosphoribosylformylglycinamidine synthase subunit PurS [Candidatus Deferrimicrobiaceae bacterium]
MKARIYVTLRKGVLDPQGKAIQRSLSHLGMAGVDEVRVGKFMEVTLAEMSRPEAEKLLDEACRRLLANTVIEDYRFEIEG